MLIAPRSFQACTAVTCKGALSTRPQGARGVAPKPHLISSHVAPTQLKRFLVDAERTDNVLWGVVMLRRACGAAAHAPGAGASSVSVFSGEAHVGLLVLDDVIALRAADL